MSPILEHGLRATLVWYAENRAASSLQNAFNETCQFAKFIFRCERQPIVEITLKQIHEYRVVLGTAEEWRLNWVVAVLNRWNALGYVGVPDALVTALSTLRLTNNVKGAAVATWDPSTGPLTDIEREALEAKINQAYGGGHLSLIDYTLLWCLLLWGLRIGQVASLKVCDVIVKCSKGDTRSYFLRVPRAKQRKTLWRSQFKYRALLPEFGALFVKQCEAVRANFRDLLDDPETAPLIPSPRSKAKAGNFAFHYTAKSLANRVISLTKNLHVYSERTGQPVHLPPVRSRRTFGTRAAAEGHSLHVLAELLDHSDVGSAQVYVAATPKMLERIDRAVALRLAPLARAFEGVVIDSKSQATGASDSSSRIFDARRDQNPESVGNCGMRGFCGFNAPIACYTCSYFEAFADAPHESILDHLLTERLRFMKETDERIATINDRTILAVAHVVHLCRVRRGEPKRK